MNETKNEHSGKFAVDTDDECPMCRKQLIDYEWPYQFGKTLKCLDCSFEKEVSYNYKKDKK